MPAVEKDEVATPLGQDDIASPAAGAVEYEAIDTSPDVLEDMMSLGTNPQKELDEVVPGRDITHQGTMYHYAGGVTSNQPLLPSASGAFWPVEGSISSDFGGARNHRGVDFAAPTGTPIRAPIGGVVTRVRTIQGSYGKHVYVQAPDGTEMRFAHMNSFNVRQGQQVAAGTVLGTVGSTGRSTGPHLHFEVLQGGRPIDPLYWLGEVQQAATLATPQTYSGQGALNYAQLQTLAQSVGFNSSEARVMAAIALAESGGNPNSLNPNASTGDLSYGLWQINMIGSMGPARRRQFGIRANADLYDPRTNARAAFMLYRNRGNFRDWSVYNSGAYRKYLR